MEALKTELKKSNDAYQGMFNHVGVKVSDKAEQNFLMNELEAKAIFGNRIGTCLHEQYICHDSVLTNQPMTYSLVNESSDTLVMRFNRLKFLSQIPEVCQEKMIKSLN